MLHNSCFLLRFYGKLDTFMGNSSYFQPHQSLASRLNDSAISVLKKSIEEGNIKIYQDSKREHERADIILEGQGVVKIYTDYHKDFATSIMKGVCKSIEIFSKENELVGRFTLTPESQYVLHPVYRVQFGMTTIGTISGDIPLALGKILLNPGEDIPMMDGSEVTGDVIDTMRKLLAGKML